MVYTTHCLNLARSGERKTPFEGLFVELAEDFVQDARKIPADMRGCFKINYFRCKNSPGTRSPLHNTAFTPHNSLVGHVSHLNLLWNNLVQLFMQYQYLLQQCHTINGEGNTFIFRHCEWTLCLHITYTIKNGV